MDPALLAAVLADPDDDAPRLVLADWLEENGFTERAEFIRVQIELARMEGDDPRRPAFARRECALRGAQWSKLREEVSRWLPDVDCQRGFLYRANFSTLLANPHQDCEN